MSANVYSVQSLLVGKTYYSNTLQGEIIDAEPTSKVWYADCDTYRVQVRSRNSFKDTYRYVAVKTGE
jgi:hypothetical protein